MKFQVFSFVNDGMSKKGAALDDENCTRIFDGEEYVKLFCENKTGTKTPLSMEPDSGNYLSIYDERGVTPKGWYYPYKNSK